ncbi:ras and EF-hand domain-containing protein, partial [Sceloporus undulatus]|uniref:ras and EF-hand domain-containing protein n=1 Tax=Sceloporus undulatus TaxID=8520 RepID=UPI001C4BE402
WPLLRSLFVACDVKGSGRIEREDFGALCAELRVPPEEAEAIFRRLDTDRDGAISFAEFARGFRGASTQPSRSQLRRPSPSQEPSGDEDMEDMEDMEEGAMGDPGQAWRDFEARLGGEASYIPRQEQVSVLYQNINIVEPRLIQPYEHVIKNFIREIKLQSTEMENLAIAVKRAQDKAAMQLGELEEEMDQRIQAAEHKIKKEEKRKAEEALNDLKRQYETEVGDLQVTIKKLKMLEEQSRNINHKEDLAALKTRIHDLTLENQRLKKNLMEAQTNIAFLQSELDTLKSDIADHSLSSERDLDMIRGYTEDRDSLERQIVILQSANRKLHDSNDGLRSALENSWSIYNKSLRLTNSSPGNTLSRSSPKHSGGQSPQNPHYDRESDATDCSSRYPSSEKAYKIVLAGDAAVGKSSFLMRLCKNEFRGNTSATLGVDFQMKRLIVDGEPTVLQLWDTAGQERFRSIAKSYFRRADGVLLLYDVTCEKSFLNVREWVDMIADATHENIPIMMVGNKADLRQVVSEQGQKCVPINYGEKLAMAYSALFCETSAKDGSNIVEAVLHLAREVRKRSDSKEEDKSVTNLSGTTLKKSTFTKNCCSV